MNNVRQEIELYEPMTKWLEQHLKDCYKNVSCDVIVEDTHALTLDTVLAKHGILEQYPQAVGMNIQIDVLGIVKLRNHSDIIFIEAKKTALNLHDLGQLWAYCKLINPTDAYLLSSHSLGSLDNILKTYSREDMLDFGNGKMIKKMKVAKWDIVRNTIDSNSMIPKI